jgi:circadian clock protein KaiC
MASARARRILPSGKSPISKSPTGITGLDSITQGGFPRDHITLIEGGPGAGKTVLTLQSLVHAARHLGEPGIFVAFEETSANIVANAAGFGWDLPALQKKNLFFLDVHPSLDLIQSGGFDLGGMLAALDAKIDSMKAQHIAFDAIDVVLSLLENPEAERRELYRLRDWIAGRGLTTLITSKWAQAESGQQRGEFLQFMSDCAVRLEHIVEQGVSERNLRVIKYRGSEFHENAAPYVIGASGLDVATVCNVESVRGPITAERISTGVPRLDTMLGGGYFRGAGILVTGAPGTAKTTLCGAFCEAACKRGEPTLYVSFDSDTLEIARNLSSVGINLDRYSGTGKRPGLLRLSFQRALDGSAETHLLEIQNLARAHRARCVVIDPLSALVNFSDISRAQGVAIRLMNWAKIEGITLLCTSLLNDGAVEKEGSPLHISTVADTWIHLSYIPRNGERNRCLSIIKSRGTAHSSQVREMVLTRQGVTLTDPYTAGGEVLLGTLRWERERAEEALRRENADRQRLAQLKLLAEEAALSAQVIALQAQLEAARAALKTMTSSDVTRREAAASSREGTRSRRGADSAPARPRKPPAR